MIIKSSKALCEDYQAISKLAHEFQEPIYITYEGEGDLVLLSMGAYERGLKVSGPSSPPVQRTGKAELRKGKGDNPMSETELGAILREMYENAPRGDQAVQIHLFAIKYADEMTYRRVDKKEILKYAGLSQTYLTEISKGIKLAKYVTIKPEHS